MCNLNNDGNVIKIKPIQTSESFFEQANNIPKIINKYNITDIFPDK